MKMCDLGTIISIAKILGETRSYMTLVTTGETTDKEISLDSIVFNPRSSDSSKEKRMKNVADSIIESMTE